VPNEDIARACGFPFVRVVGSFQLKRLPGILEEALRQEGPALVVSRQACALEPSEIGRRSIVARIDEALCDGCLACVDEFGCPAFVPAPSGSGKIEVDGLECNGCAACKFVCPDAAISFDLLDKPKAFRDLTVETGREALRGKISAGKIFPRNPVAAFLVREYFCWRQFSQFSMRSRGTRSKSRRFAVRSRTSFTSAIAAIFKSMVPSRILCSRSFMNSSAARLSNGRTFQRAKKLNKATSRSYAGICR
jgi:ferredoxin